MVFFKSHLLFAGLFCFWTPSVSGNDDNTYLLKIETNGDDLIKSVEPVTPEICKALSCDDTMNFRVNPNCNEFGSEQDCISNTHCTWESRMCWNQNEDGTARSMGVYTNAYTNGVNVELFPEKRMACKSALGLNAPTVNMWSRGVKAVIYLFFLMYVFLGVAIVADIFMSAIESITASEREVVVDHPQGKGQVTLKVRVWNETVANLTLLALGSSAPEIILATLETLQTLGEPAGELGPSTIVGSAAFNLFVISAVCMISVPPAERNETGIRKISELGVFLITAFGSVFAYLWMLFVIVISSPKQIDLWEALVTFAMFPVLVLIAYLQDAKKLSGMCGGKDDGRAGAQRLGGNEKLEINAVVRRDTHFQTAKELAAQGDTPNEDQLRAVAERAYHKNAPEKPKHSYMMYRVNAARMLAGKKSVIPDKQSLEEKEKELANLQRKSGVDIPKPEFETKIEFNTPEYAVREDAGAITIAVTRTGNLAKMHTVSYKTVDGTAHSPGDYKGSQSSLTFAEGERVKTFEIDIMEDEEVESDEFFYIVLEDPTGDSVELGSSKICTVKILDVSNPGKVGFKYLFKRVQESKGSVKLVVQRKEGGMGSFFVDWKTQDGTGIAGVDYTAAQGTLKFDAGEMRKDLRITILDNEEHEGRDRSFEIVLSNPTNENNTAQLIDDKKVCRVDISDDENYSKVVNKIMSIWDKQKKQFSVSTSSWKEQFEVACEPPNEPTPLDFFMHFLSFPWKMIFAFVPPTEYRGGWISFFTSLICIGGVTMLIGDFAATFGCMMGLSNSVVAISIVALGTSMPDTFASRTATIMAPDADAALGNVTGSNSVNVFLGLGLPWVIATCYAVATGSVYQTPPGTISVAVAIFTPAALMCLGTLLVRRKVVGGELGGGSLGRWLTFFFFVMLWALWLLICILYDYEVIAF